MERDRAFFSYRNENRHFNSHAHVERDFKFVNVALRKEHFNSHAHVERDVVATITPYVEDISTHTLTWSVTFRNTGRTNCNWISTHTLTWSVTGEKLWEFVAGIHFNSHAHVERDSKMISHLFTEMISTHTLTWSVTSNRFINT